MRQEIPLFGGEARSRAVSVNNQGTVNLMNAKKGYGAKAPIVLESVPGLVERAAGGDGPCRTPKMENWKGHLYAVAGTKLVQIDENLTLLEVGTLSTSQGVVRMARGRNHLMLVDGTAGYYWDGTTFATITDLDFPNGATHVTYQDGFFIVNDPSTDNFYISETVEDASAWNALDFEAASVAPDAALAHASTASILYIAGEETTQLYYNDGNPDFPYAVYLHATQEVGIKAPQSIAETDDGVFFLATTPEGGLFVYRIKGTDGMVITEDEQDDQLAAVADPSTAYGFIYKQSGKSFYVLQLDNGLTTLVYNIKVGVWEQRQMQDESGWRASGHGVIAGKNIVGSRLAARFYELDLDAYTDAGEELVRRRVTEVFHNRGHLMDWWELVVDVDSGVGNSAAPDPMLRLRYSDDHGATWSDQILEPIGKQGERMRRAVYRNLGASRHRIFELEYAEATPLTIINGYAVVEALSD